MAPAPKLSAARPLIDTAVLNANLISVKESVSEIKATLSELTKAVNGIERIEERQLTLVSDLEQGAKESALLEDRVTAIERDMPGLRELRRWVVGGMVSGIGMMLIAVASLVLYPRQYVVLTSPSYATTSPAKPSEGVVVSPAQ